MTIYVRILGDLDNLYWMLNGKGNNVKDAQANCFDQQLQHQLGDSYQVVSHACAGFTTSSVLQGDQIDSRLPEDTAKTDAYINIKRSIISSSLTIKPIEELEKEISKSPTAIHYVIISAGLNDFRENLPNSIQLLKDVPNIQSRYLEILKQVQQLGENIRPILVFQYRPPINDPIYTKKNFLRKIVAVTHCIGLVTFATVSLLMVARKISNWKGTILNMAITLVLARSFEIIPFKATVSWLQGQDIGLSMLGILLEKFYQPIVKRAISDKLPILDLTNSFDPYDSALYIGSMNMPNIKGGRLIAQGLSHIIKGNNSNPAHGYKASKIYDCHGHVGNLEWHVKQVAAPD